MNQKEFELIADVINITEDEGRIDFGLLVENFTIALGDNYPKTFDPNKFLKLLGL